MIKIIPIGVSEVLAKQCIPVEVLLGHLQPRKPGGVRPVTANDVWKMFGIRKLSHFIDPITGLRLTPKEGGKSDTDLAVEACRAAIVSAGLNIKDLNIPTTAIVHLTCTPSRANLCNSLGDLKYALGLPSAHAETHNLGCAAVAFGFHQAEILLTSSRHPFRYLLLVATNAVEGPVIGHPEIHERIRDHRDPEAWFSALFSSGGGCILFEARDEGGSSGGLISSGYATLPIELVDYPGGGSAQFVLGSNINDQAYLMHGQVVGREFVRCVRLAMEMLQKDWLERIEPFVKKPFSVDLIKRFYLHQPNLWRIRDAAQSLGIPLDKVPTLVEDYGNLTAASTPILYHRDVKAGVVKSGDVVVFLVAGAGLGAMYGYGLMIVP